MASIFLSHSSRDDALASDLEAWLHAGGFTDIFVDHSSIRSGDKWADALRASAGSCRVVVCLVTPNWLASPECPSEFRAAWYMGKPIVPLFLLEESALPESSLAILNRVRAEFQGLDLRPLLTEDGKLSFGRDETRADTLRKGLRAAGALTKVGLDPESFVIDRNMRLTPFPGLASFGDDDADAALFFGRSREIAETLEEIRAMRAVSDRRVLMILGASGAGKSSLLKAGIIPRLRREAPAWIPLRAFRPGADPLLNFAEALTRTLADFGAGQPIGACRNALLDAWKAAARDSDGLTPSGCETIGVALGLQAERLRAAATRPEATILISVDQAEELTRADGESGEALADYLRVAMDAGGAWRLAFTIRTDSFPELQEHRHFRRLEARGYDLRALPAFRFNEVVEEPAKRYGVEIEPELVDALMEDAAGGDALPLLAFAMQRLWAQFSAHGRLTIVDYQSTNGLAGLIETAAERALAGIDPDQPDKPTTQPSTALAERAAGIFVPQLVDVNDEGAAIRRVAPWDAFSAASQDMLTRFERWRLIVRKGEAGTVEVAHEALFRKWPRLAAWLEPERALLEALRGLLVAAPAWKRNAKDESLLLHFGDRLKAASALAQHPRYAAQLSDDSRAYLAACSESERAERSRRIAICFDGSWVNSLNERATNIGIIARSIPSRAGRVEQAANYVPGSGSQVQAFRGRMSGLAAFNAVLMGTFAEGLEDSVLDTYIELSFRYEPGDAIYLFGYSRGAYAAQALGGLIGTCGILNRRYLAKAGDAWRLYRDAKVTPDSPEAVDFRTQFGKRSTDDDAPRAIDLRPQIAYMGIFETVGRRGLPSVSGPLRSMRNRRLELHDLAPGRHVLAARHALAIDERRRAFPPMLWPSVAKPNAHAANRGHPAPHQQKWFAGVHDDIGGGRRSPLSAFPLQWIVEGAEEAGLIFAYDHESALNLTLHPQNLDARAPISGPRGLAWLSPIHWLGGWRKIPSADAASDVSPIHESVAMRVAATSGTRRPYRPPPLKPFMKHLLLRSAGVLLIATLIAALGRRQRGGRRR